MSQEGTLLRGRIAQAEQRQRTLRLQAKSHVVAMRQDIDPYEPNPAKLQTERICEAANALHDIANELRQLDAALTEMRADLG